MKLAGEGYIGESGLPGVAYGGSLDSRVSYTAKSAGHPDVAYTGESRSVVWHAQGSPQKFCSHKSSLAKATLASPDSPV